MEIDSIYDGVTIWSDDGDFLKFDIITLNDLNLIVNNIFICILQFLFECYDLALFLSFYH